MCSMAATKKSAKDVEIYDSLAVINRAFGQVFIELDQIRQDRRFRKSNLLKSVDLAIRETQAGTLFEILEVLHEHEQQRWARLGRERKREDEQDPV